MRSIRHCLHPAALDSLLCFPVRLEDTISVLEAREPCFLCETQPSYLDMGSRTATTASKRRANLVHSRPVHTPRSPFLPPVPPLQLNPIRRLTDISSQDYARSSTARSSRKTASTTPRSWARHLRCLSGTDCRFPEFCSAGPNRDGGDDAW